MSDELPAFHFRGTVMDAHQIRNLPSAVLEELAALSSLLVALSQMGQQLLSECSPWQNVECRVDGFMGDMHIFRSVRLFEPRGNLLWRPE